jgi:hypothetical protein
MGYGLRATGYGLRAIKNLEQKGLDCNGDLPEDIDL